MKKHFKFLSWILIPCFFLIACGGDDDDDDGGYIYSFKNQNLQGIINGKSWTFIDGEAEEDFFTAGKISIELGAVELTDPCNSFLEGLRVFFSVNNTIGIYELQFDFDNTDNSQTVTLFDPDDGNLNIIANQGAIEILTIEVDEITGRIDVYFDEETNVNGNFSVTYCTD